MINYYIFYYKVKLLKQHFSLPGLKEDVEDHQNKGEIDDWVQCENESCQKWHHIYCVNTIWQRNVIPDQLWFCCNNTS